MYRVNLHSQQSFIRSLVRSREVNKSTPISSTRSRRRHHSSLLIKQMLLKQIIIIINFGSFNAGFTVVLAYLSTSQPTWLLSLET